MFFNRPKRYPNLEEYLGKRPVEISSREKVLLWALGALVCFVAIVPAAIFLPLAKAALVTAVGASSGALMIIRAIRESRKRLPFAQQEGLHTRRQLKNALDAGGMDHIIPASIGAVLDECVVAAKRVEVALAGPTWQDPALPQHWVSVRDNAMRAADNALDEAFALTGPHLNENWQERPIQSLQHLIQRIVGTEEIPMTPLPPSFRPALDLADRLRTLALEIETVTHEVASESTLRGNLAASTRLDSVLTEIRGLQSAEQELHQDN